MLDQNQVGDVVAKGTHHNALYESEGTTCKQQALIAKSSQIHLWYEMVGHLNYFYLGLLKKNNLVDGLPEIQGKEGVCEGCMVGKQHHEKFQKNAWRESYVLQLVHSDICGPMKT